MGLSTDQASSRAPRSCDEAQKHSVPRVKLSRSQWQMRPQLPEATTYHVMYRPKKVTIARWLQTGGVDFLQMGIV